MKEEFTSKELEEIYGDQLERAKKTLSEVDKLLIKEILDGAPNEKLEGLLQTRKIAYDAIIKIMAKKTKVVILDNNPVSIACYLEEFGDKYDL